MTKYAKCPKCGRRDALDVTSMGDQVTTVVCQDCGQQPPD
jgi:Zn ribbon nucleic-acid-binding protein